MRRRILHNPESPEKAEDAGESELHETAEESEGSVINELVDHLRSTGDYSKDAIIEFAGRRGYASKETSASPGDIRRVKAKLLKRIRILSQEEIPRRSAGGPPSNVPSDPSTGN